ncbi:hypothetical protein NIES4071_80150 [Calothrix sp. NIES-4071]|nr:hypothetical protein NIES4071_80150 [Calothrix sp. NIES-4071]BAZ62285.1 hypothetical protein NIES4105_80080 [Calothrix sp. NIES-4105]
MQLNLRKPALQYSTESRPRYDGRIRPAFVKIENVSILDSGFSRYRDMNGFWIERKVSNPESKIQNLKSKISAIRRIQRGNANDE